MDEKKNRQYEGIEDGKRYIFTVDKETGDVISKIPIIVRRDTSQYYKKGEFLTMHIRISKMLMQKKQYGNLTFRVLFALMERIEFNNRIRTFRQSELAQILNAHQPDVSKSLKVLINDGVIKKSDHDYYFSPQFVRYVNDGNFGSIEEETE